MTEDDPFERAARREQQIRRVLQMRANSKDERAWRDGSLVLLAVWGVFLFGHYWLLGPGATFFVHASIFGIAAVMLLVPTMVVSALWAPFLIAHYHYAGFDTPFKVHLLFFAATFVRFAFVSLPTRSDKEPLERGLSL
jgi:hypothetical protein